MAEVRILLFLVSWKGNLQTGGSLQKDEISEKRLCAICNLPRYFRFLPRYFRLLGVGEFCVFCSQNSDDGQNSVEQIAILTLKSA